MPANREEGVTLRQAGPVAGFGYPVAPFENRDLCGVSLAGAKEVLPGAKILFQWIVVNAFLPPGAGGTIFRRFADQSFRSEFLAVAVEGEGAHRCF